MLWTLLGGGVLLAIVLITVLNAGAYAFSALGVPLAGVRGYEEIVRLSVGAAVSMLLPYCQMQRGHVAVDLLVERFPGGVRRAIDRLSLALMGLLAVFLTYWLILGLLENRADGVVSPLLGWAEWPFYLPVVLSLALWALVAFTLLVAPVDG